MPVLFIILISLLIPVTGCLPDSEKVESTATVHDWLPLKIGDVALNVQIAFSREEQRTGLMHRDSLPENNGMLFPYARPQQLGFWMANTRIPLDIGFFDGSGRLLEVHRMVPFDTNRTQSNARDVQFALEMNAGWYSANKIFPGQRMDMEALASAMRSRGVDPATFGIKE